MIYRAGDLEIDTHAMVARRAGAVVKLRPRPFALLHVLMINRDRVVSREEIVEAVWDGRAVSDSAVLTAIRDLRRALGDDGTDGGLVRTFYGRGLRLMIPSTSPAGSEASATGSGTETGTEMAANRAGTTAPGPHSGGPPTELASADLSRPRLLGAGGVEAIRHLLGVYHIFYRTPSWPNAIKCGVSVLSEEAGWVSVRTTEHGRDEAIGIRQRARYRGFAEVIDGRVYIVEQNTRPPRAVCLSSLDTPHPFQPGTMSGLMMGSSWRARGAPYTTRVIWRRLPPDLSLREAILRSGPLGDASPELDPTIRNALGLDCLTFEASTNTL